MDVSYVTTHKFNETGKMVILHISFCTDDCLDHGYSYTVGDSYRQIYLCTGSIIHKTVCCNCLCGYGFLKKGEANSKAIKDIKNGSVSTHIPFYIRADRLANK